MDPVVAGLIGANLDSHNLPPFTYGEARAYWGFNNIAASTLISDDLWTHVVVVGAYRGKGFYYTINIVNVATSPAIQTSFDWGILPVATSAA